MERWLVVLLAAAILGPLTAAQGHCGGDPVTLAFHEKDGHFDVLGGFQVKADPKVVWDTLTDYEAYPRFSHELKKVQVKERSENHMVVEEMAESGFLFFTQRVYFLMDVQLVPGLSIVSVDTGHKSFVSYRGEWQIKPPEGPGDIGLTYHLQAEGHFDGPAFMVNDAFQGGVKNFMENMRKEILRRQSQPAPAPTATSPTH